ncbi:MAG: pentapeptide repeat-containing protein, partial [Planctomycetota bacterium]|nr:pentapeptide repeat-containing protein [Planctomycetota bacterium]
MSLLEILSVRRESGAPSPGRLLGSKDPEEEELRRRWSEEHPDGGTRSEAMLRRLESIRANFDRSQAGESPAGESFAGADLRGVNLADADLSGLDLSGADLS